jgi:hypothetical protein
VSLARRTVARGAGVHAAGWRLDWRVAERKCGELQTFLFLVGNSAKFERQSERSSTQRSRTSPAQGLSQLVKSPRLVTLTRFESAIFT